MSEGLGGSDTWRLPLKEAPGPLPVTAVDRAAQAIWRAGLLGRLPPEMLKSWEDTDEISRQSCRDYARAVVASLREPTEAMVAAVTLDHDIQGVVYMRGPAVWQTMIDAILAEPA